jgi:hypothetical protein
MSDEYVSFPIALMLAIGEAREAGARAERERIIAILQEDCDQGIGDNLDGCFHEVTIALIEADEIPIVQDNDATYNKGGD